ncbi:MAG: F0F1 ATP synthase subunit epsilon [Armatimonadota bacterium]
MAEKTFKLEIVTPESIVLKQEAVSIVVPGVDGSLGILADHAPLMAELTSGVIRMRDANGDESCMAVSGGFMEVSSNTVRILADTAELACNIDLQRAEEALRRAEERLRSVTQDVDVSRAEAALKRALARIRALRG